MPAPWTPMRLLAVFLLATVPLAQESEAPTNAAVDALFTKWDRDDTPGAAVAVVHEGEIVHAGGYGLANIEHGVPITPETVFDIASVSKQFTGLAIAMLVERGTLSLDDDVRRHLPEFPDFGTTVTVRHLVHHTSGLRDWPGTFMLAGKRMDDVIAFEEILDLVWRQRDLNFTPGSEHLYSNTGYNLLAEIVAHTTGKSFRGWTHENLFAPLGMATTHFQTDHREVIPDRAYGYEQGARGAFLALHDGLTAQGSSSLFSTVQDLARWTVHLDAPGENRPAVARMHERGVLNDGTRLAYAFGVSIGSFRGLRTVAHSGGWAGFRTYLVRVPAHRFAVIVLSNLASFDPARRANEIIELYLGEHLEPSAARVAPPASLAEVDVGRDVLDAYTGTYRLGDGWLVTITRDADRLLTQATAESRFPMRAVSQTEFFVSAYGASMTFRRDGKGEVTGLLYKGIEAPRIAPFLPTPDDLAAFVGVYESEELGTSLGLAIDDGRLVAHHPRHGDVTLFPAESDAFRTTAWWMGTVAFARDAGNQVTALSVTAGRVRNLRFDRR